MIIIQTRLNDKGDLNQYIRDSNLFTIKLILIYILKSFFFPVCYYVATSHKDVGVAYNPCMLDQ